MVHQQIKHSDLRQKEIGVFYKKNSFFFLCIMTNYNMTLKGHTNSCKTHTERVPKENILPRMFFSSNQNKYCIQRVELVWPLLITFFFKLTYYDLIFTI